MSPKKRIEQAILTQDQNLFDRALGDLYGEDTQTSFVTSLLDLSRRFSRRDFFILTPQNKVALARYRRMLESAPAAAVMDDMRDQRFDSTLATTQMRRAALPKERIDRMCARYEQRCLREQARQLANWIVSQVRYEVMTT